MSRVSGCVGTNLTGARAGKQCSSPGASFECPTCEAVLCSWHVVYSPAGLKCPFCTGRPASGPVAFVNSRTLHDAELRALANPRDPIPAETSVTQKPDSPQKVTP